MSFRNARPSLVCLVFASTIAIATLGCGSVQSPPATKAASPTPVATVTPAPLQHERLNAVLWMRRSGEFKGLSHQAFLTARTRLDQALADPAKWQDAVPSPNPSAKAYAVIVDVDETVLDNTPEEVEFIQKDRRRYDDVIWKAWESRGVAQSLPGAVDFLKYAKNDREVEVFYVTNRSDKEKLFSNLSNEKFPVSLDHILVQGEHLSGSPTNKEGRRRFIAAEHRVLLEVGDDLGDFFDTTGLDAMGRAEAARRSSDRWGREWILLPNPAYGGWDRVFYSSTDKDDEILPKKRKALEE